MFESKRQYKCLAPIIQGGFVLLCLGIITFMRPVPVYAALGGDASSVTEDVVHLQGSLLSIRAPNYTVHEIHAATGTVVREYVSPSGTVFAVAWQGPWLPDMRHLLGNYFDQYVEALQGQRSVRFGRRPIHVELPGLVVQLSGHPRSFAGRAYVPERLPQGVQAEDIR